MDLGQALYSRRAVRNYTAETVDQATLGKLIDAAIQAPSAVNEQPWSFTVVTDRALLERISEKAKAYLLRGGPARVPAESLRRRLEDPAFDIFYHAPALIVICSVERSRWAVENCALAAENLMLAACGEGLGSCWIGFAQSWLATRAGKAALELPAPYLPVAPIIVGRPAAPAAAVPRRAPRIRWIGP